MLPHAPLRLPNLSLQLRRTIAFFSTAPQPAHLFQLPPNLKIDPRSRSSPTHGADRIHRDDDDDTTYDLSTLPPPTPLAVPLPHRLHVDIVDLSSSTSVGTLHLSPRTFGCDPVRIDILHRCIVYQRNAKRGRRNAGARTKTISEVSGSGRKVRQQKGTGKARAGHSRPAHWRGGAKAHGPKGRVQDYTTKLNKKVWRMGMRHVLSQKLLEGNLVILNDLRLETHKTGRLEKMLRKFGVGRWGRGKFGVGGLFVDDAKEEEGEEGVFVSNGVNLNFRVASGNIPRVQVVNQLGCNVYDVLKHQKLFLTLSAVSALEARLEKDLKK